VARYERSYTGEHRTEFIGFYVTPSERRLLHTAASERGASINILARDIVLERSAARPVGRSRLYPEAAAIMRQLEKAQHALDAVGNLLNQIARHANMTGQLSREHLDDLAEVFGMIKRAIEQYTIAVQVVISLER
jgi:Bacterial mobilisation protein (MobC)